MEVSAQNPEPRSEPNAVNEHPTVLYRHSISFLSSVKHLFPTLVHLYSFFFFLAQISYFYNLPT